MLEPFPFDDQTDMSVGGALHDFIDGFLNMIPFFAKVNKLKDDKQCIYSDASVRVIWKLCGDQMSYNYHWK